MFIFTHELIYVYTYSYIINAKISQYSEFLKIVASRYRNRTQYCNVLFDVAYTCISCIMVSGLCHVARTLMWSNANMLKHTDCLCSIEWSFLGHFCLEMEFGYADHSNMTVGWSCYVAWAFCWCRIIEIGGVLTFCLGDTFGATFNLIGIIVIVDGKQTCLTIHVRELFGGTCCGSTFWHM